MSHANCNRCPNWCNKRGICTAPHEGGYCDCFYGFTGDDCSLRLCPAGFDPLQINTLPNRRTIRLITGNLGGFNSGKFEFQFSGASVYLNADSTELDSNACTSTLSTLKSITKINCTRETFNMESKTGSYLIRLDEFPSQPHLNNLIYHTGNPSLELFHCNTSKIDHEDAIGPYCEFEDVITDNIPGK
jgi:hypothetical protein